MRTFRISAILVGLPLTAMASSLQDWAPHIDLSSLTSACQIAYTQQISGCSSSDFQTGASCSAACVKGLEILATTAKKACGSEDHTSDTTSDSGNTVPVALSSNIIVSFVDGTGPERVCPNNSLAPGTSTAVKTTTTSSIEAATASSSLNEMSTATSTQSGTSTASPATSSSKQTVTSSVSASTTTAFQLVTTSTAGSTTPTPSHSQGGQDDGSGGGSPFDISSNAVVFSIPVATTLLTAMLIIAGFR